MPSLVDNLGSFVSSIFGVITSIFGSILAVFQTLINAILGVIGTAFSAVGTMVAGLANTFEGLIKFFFGKFAIKLQLGEIQATVADFLTGNIVVIGAVVGAIFLYGVYQQRNGKAINSRPAGAKKIN